MESSPQDRQSPSAVAGSGSAAEPTGGDRLTIRRLLILTAGVAVALGILQPQLRMTDATSLDDWLSLSAVFLVGLSLPAPLFTVRWRGGRTGPGALFALTSGLGSILLLGPVLIGRVTGRDGDTALTCLVYCLPLMSVWYLLAALLSGQIGRRLFRSEIPWTERYGFFLATLWAPWGIWRLVEIYWEVL